MKNIRLFYLKIFSFWKSKFSVYLNRHVFVMGLKYLTLVSSEYILHSISFDSNEHTHTHMHACMHAHMHAHTHTHTHKHTHMKMKRAGVDGCWVRLFSDI